MKIVKSDPTKIFEKAFEIICPYCKKKPHEIGEYIDLAIEKGVTPNEFVQQEEGTYNPTNGHFCCTLCYMKIGMPDRPGGWRSP